MNIITESPSNFLLTFNISDAHNNLLQNGRLMKTPKDHPIQTFVVSAKQYL